MTPGERPSIGLIAGNGRLPALFAQAARAEGLHVHAVAHQGETDPSLAALVDSVSWVKVGQAEHIVRALRARGVEQAVMAGGISRVRSFSNVWPDAGTFKIVGSLRSLSDDGLLRAAARYFEQNGVEIVSATRWVKTVLAQEGHLAGPKLTLPQEADVALGREVASSLGNADVGQTVVVKDRTVIAVEAIEGTDACIRRAGLLAGPGAVVVKRLKPTQDQRFDLPAIGPVTLEVMREAGARVLAIDAGKTVLLDAEVVFSWAERLGISLVGVRLE